MKKLFAVLSLSAVASLTTAQDNNQIDPKLTEFWEPVPAVVTPDPVPSDAIVLFDGTNLEAWKGKDGPAPWTVKNGYMTVNPGKGGISTKQSFCDMQLHIEWRVPEKTPGKEGQQQNNSGVFLQGRYEVQVLDSYENRTYSNGQAGSVYKQSLPLVNAMKPPTHWNTYDIIFKAPRFSESGELTSKAHVTVLHNGVLVQNHTEIQGGTTYRGQPSYSAHGCAPIFLQDHGNYVSFKNIWVREL
ncbi:DUF1080 domain-containing protein [Paraglaciecola aquimarina]|uniref:DUF1080 domain-containing protein n=2 Tax=Paraglaciecola algarum TaxID=3050085 RepID=A0ABS9D4Q8_9ALTE|nr:DUF1080 domain-containing protein [Paraglaciecola sp. G1-23]MCF2947913.1 DUF1080 domain-containing protein [Paraglaciecola sp. G1-23]